MFFENTFIRYLVIFVGFLCLLNGAGFLLRVSFIALVVVRLPRLERMLEQEKDAHRQKVLAKKVRFWRDAHGGIEISAKKRGVDVPPETLLRMLLEKRSHFITLAFLLCLIGIASLMWAFGYFG